MAKQIDTDAAKALNVMATAATTLREAISKSLPVANNQVLTVTIPGTVLNYDDYYYDQKTSTFAPLSVRVNEARLVDGMLPLSKISMGKTGKSVARSYMSALDLLIPVEASVSGLVATPSTTKAMDPQRKIIKDRYDEAMKYLKSPEEESTAQGTAPASKLSRYVQKQEAWAKAVEDFAVAQERQQKLIAGQYPKTEEGIKTQRNEFMLWLQSSSREYKAAIQARYMDWVVHGYKFNIEFNFGIVDISSGMKRVEASKEAHRNLVIIAEDGFSEFSQVKLEPTNWATHVRNKVIKWNNDHRKPTPDEIRAEIKRLQNLLLSHQALKAQAESPDFYAVLPPDLEGEADETLRKAYADVYENEQKRSVALYKDKKPLMPEDKKETETTFKNLVETQQKWKTQALQGNKQAQKATSAENKKDIIDYLARRISSINVEIDDLKSSLGPLTAYPIRVIGDDGNVVEESELKRDPNLTKPPGAETTEEADPWTRITVKVSSSRSESSKVSEESASSFAAKARWGLWKASGGASHTSSSVKAMSSMSNLDVEVSMDCMVVNIERPWLHGELFSDSDLDVGSAFKLSPGEKRLQEMVDNNEICPAEYQQFPAYPTAFVVAANVELNFNGDCSELSSAIKSTTTEANGSVGWGPFAVSGSHKQSKTQSSTRSESTATGMRISLQAPQIIAWAQTLLPRLPRDPSAKSQMAMTISEVVGAPAQVLAP